MMVDMAAQERSFVIVTPRQSVGPPGTTVSASRLGMTDAQLDDWVDAGHATEIHHRPVASAVSRVSRDQDAAKAKAEDDGAGDGQ